MTRFPFALALLLSVGCKDQRPPAPTAEQTQELNEAENMLDNMAPKEKGPADRSTGPSKRQ